MAKLPESKVAGDVTIKTGTVPIKDAVAIWWSEYGSSKNLLHIHLFTKKLTVKERTTFVEKMDPLTDLNVFFNGKKGYDPVFYLPRVTLQMGYSEA